MTRAALLLALTFGTAAPASAVGVASVEFLDVGQGDAVLIRSPEGKTALIDAGPTGRVLRTLRARGVASIDLAVVSHHHADHYGGMAAVVRAYRPRYVLATASAQTSPTYLRLLRDVRDSGATALYPGPEPRRFELGSVTLTVLPQPPEDVREENNNSIGLRVQYGAVSVLLTGDSETLERRWWLARCPDLIADATVLKLAHHGGRNGTDARWLDTVRPSLAVASVGADNGFGHPHRATLGLLERRNIPLLRTDRDGTVAVVSDGRTWRVVGRQVSPRGPPSPAQAARVDLNTATLEELIALPGVGQVTAERIVAGRPYGAVDDLKRVKGLGGKRLEELRPLVGVE